MLSTLQDALANVTMTPELMAMIGLGIGVFVFVLGFVGSTAGPGPELRRMHVDAHNRPRGADFDLIRTGEDVTNTFLKTFVPSSKRERTKIATRMRQAGLHGKRALRFYYLSRAILGLGLPGIFVALTTLPLEIQADLGINQIMSGIGMVASFQIVTVLLVFGFYAPSWYLSQRIRRRRQRIWNNLPNALDLMQVAVEAGLGFDAAMVRVSHELATVSPEISQEFMMLQLEIQAGKEREAAFMDMAMRTGLDEVKAFANVILQSAEFGTSVSTALTNYASDLRVDRELKAQQKANRLPVQMSGVMALCMMPVLLMICLSPMVIRWIRMFG